MQKTITVYFLTIVEINGIIRIDKIFPSLCTAMVRFRELFADIRGESIYQRIMIDNEKYMIMRLFDITYLTDLIGYKVADTVINDPVKERCMFSETIANKTVGLIKKHNIPFSLNIKSRDDEFFLLTSSYMNTDVKHIH